MRRIGAAFHLFGCISHMGWMLWKQMQRNCEPRQLRWWLRVPVEGWLQEPKTSRHQLPSYTPKEAHIQWPRSPPPPDADCLHHPIPRSVHSAGHSRRTSSSLVYSSFSSARCQRSHSDPSSPSAIDTTIFSYPSGTPPSMPL
jgi:hypothetical protein